MGLLFFHKLPNGHPLFKHVPSILCGVAQNGFSRFYIAHNARSRTYGSPRMDGGMVFYRSTATNNNAIAQGYRTSESAVSSHDAEPPHYTVVGYLHEVVDFAAIANDRGTEFSPIYARIGANFNIMPNNNIANLRYFYQTLAIITGPVTKTIGANTYVGMKNTVTANDTTLANNRTRPNYGIIAYGGFVKNAHIGV